MYLKIKSPPVIIIGMHRSGTTLISSVLESLGVFMGRDKEHNNESMFFLQLNDWIFLQAGASWDRPMAVRKLTMNDRLIEPVINILKAMMQGWRFSRYLGWHEYIRSKNKGVQLQHWGWKDPRNSFTLPIWQRIFPNAKVILVTRHGVDVAKSLQVRSTRMLTSSDSNFLINIRRYRSLKFNLRSDELTNSVRCLDLDESFALWKEYMEEGANASVGENFMEVNYENFLANPKIGVRRLADFCGLPPDDLKLDAVCAQINGDRAYAYQNDEALQAFASEVKETLLRFGYKA